MHQELYVTPVIEFVSKRGCISDCLQEETPFESGFCFSAAVLHIVVPAAYRSASPLRATGITSLGKFEPWAKRKAK